MIAETAKHFVFLLLLILISSGAAPVWSAQGAQTVALVIDEASHIHDKAVAGIKQTVEDSGKANVVFRTINIKDPHSSEALHARDIDYAIVIGVKPALLAMKHKPDYPVLYTLIPESTYEEIIHHRIPASALSPENDYVIYLGQPAARQLALSQIIMGRKSRVGMVVGAETTSEVQAIQAEAKAMQLELVVRQAGSGENTIDDMKQALKRADVYLALYDTNILNRHNAKWLLYMAYRMNKPVIGFSSSYTRAGAIASIFSTPEQIGRQSGEWLLTLLANGTVKHIQYPKYFTVSTNPNIQRLLRLERLPGDKIEDMIRNKEEVLSHVGNQ